MPVDLSYKYLGSYIPGFPYYMLEKLLVFEQTTFNCRHDNFNRCKYHCDNRPFASNYGEILHDNHLQVLTAETGDEKHIV